MAGWVEGYVKAWSSNDPDDIRALFTEDARYYTEPHAAPWSGQGEIVEQWLDRKDEPEEYTFRWEILAMDGDLGFVRGWTDYVNHEPPRSYGNLWVIRLADDGRATEYTEWYVRIRDATPPFPE
ncbi:MAG: nuclear transport factor 2 family protein [Actinomycetota bacterium]|nr:nuclear transport factor 2 family protein [Actinomycetota bacterium]